jgi:hypothetical protein
VTDICAVITNRDFLMRAQIQRSRAAYWSSGRDTENDICAMSRRAPELNRLPKVLDSIPVT